MPRNERNFCSELHRSAITIKPVFWWKIPDAGFRNWFDIVCCANKKFIAIEAKISKSKTSIPLVNLFSKREHELTALKRVEAAGGTSWVLINVFNPHKWNYVLAMSVDTYEYIVKAVEPKKSIKLDGHLLKDECIRIEKNSEGFWDLTPLV